MSIGPDLLFVYGTLMRGFRLHHLMTGQAEFVGEGTVAGRLLDLGPYPGALAEEPGTIYGEVYRLRAPGLLATLDREEGYRPDAPARSLYLRQPTVVRLADGRAVTAWIYWYHGPRGRAVPIPGGDYRQHVPARALRG